MKPGFYWARRKDNGELTVISIAAEDEVCYLGTPYLTTVDQARERFAILDRIEEPTK
jgi:hypothetical protein